MMTRKFTLIMILLLAGNITVAQIARNLENVPPNFKNTTANTDELKEAYYELYNAPGLISRGKPTVFKEEYLEAIQFPVGGIGTGDIQFNGNAEPRYWQFFNNLTHDKIPNSFFAIRVKNKDGIKVRALQTKDVGIFQKMKALEATAAFPFLKYAFKDDLPVNITMEVFNPFIPTNLKDSGIPAVFYRFSIENRTEDEVEINLLASQQNAIGFSKAPRLPGANSFAEQFDFGVKRKIVHGNNADFYGGSTNYIASSSSTKTLYMEVDMDASDEHFGQMALTLIDADGFESVQGAASWTDEQKLWNKFQRIGKISTNSKTGLSAKGSTWSGALNIPMVLKPGEKRELNLVLAWYFPNGINGGQPLDSWGKGVWEGKGNYYANHWKDIKELTSYISKNYTTLVQESEAFKNAFYQTNLPYWLVERIGNQLSILKSGTIFHGKDGYVGLWEGSAPGGGSCSGNCNHVWHYPQAHARLFPEMAKTIKEQSFRYIKEDGQIPYRQPAADPAFDGQCGDIVGAYREYLLSVDETWLKSQYPAIKKAMNYLVKKHDSDKDGWLSDLKKHTTYDASMTGNPSFLTSLYLVALKASEKMARVCNDIEQAEEWKMIAENSTKIQNEKLWNGEYFIQIPGTNKATDYENGCHSDQLLGQWWADQIGIGSMYPDYRIKSATEAVLKYNFKSNLKNHVQLARKFAKPEEASMVVTTWPGNDRTLYASGYSDEVWPTFEYTIGSTLFKYGLIQDALTILKAGYNRYDGKLKTGYKTDNGWGNFGFSGNPFGDDECGQFYGRSLSIWSVLLAAQGFDYNGPEQTIGFSPKWKPENHESFFSTAEGWGNFIQRKKNNKQENIIMLKYGKLSLSKILLDVDALDDNPTVTLTLNEQRINTTTSNDKEKYAIVFETILLKGGDVIKIVFD